MEQSTESSRLYCEICLFPHWDLDDVYELSLSDDQAQRLQTHPLDIGEEQIERLPQLAEAGCCGCRVIAKAHDVAISRAETLGDQSSDSVSDKSHPLPEVARVSLFRRNRQGEGLFLMVYFASRHLTRSIDLFTLPDAPTFPGLRIARPIPSDTQLTTCLPQVKTWLSACLTEHSLCKSSGEHWPPRLLDLNIGRDEYGGHDQRIRLISTDAMMRSGKQGRYACLSHCWGKTCNSLLTTTKTLRANMAGIQLHRLPQTFQDAVQTCRALDVTYLWIDSLCIIQDSLQDWQDHVKEMATIYRNAFCTLAAGASKDGEGGFFRQARPRFTDLDVCSVNRDGTQHQIFFRARPSHPFSGAAPCWPVTERGWVLQEYVLSPHLIGFGPDEVYWSCSEACSCSCSVGNGPFKPDTVDDDDGDDSYMQGIKAWIFASSGSESPLTDRRNATDRWRELMGIYGQLQLTFASDRLPAITGLARAFKKSSTDEYLAGMWRSSIAIDLAWYSEIFPDGSSRVEQYGPSWSFLSTMAAGYSVNWDSPSDLTYDVIAVSVIRNEDDDDEFGPVVSGTLTIHGILLELVFTSQADIVADMDPFDDIEQSSAEIPVRLTKNDTVEDSGTVTNEARKSFSTGGYCYWDMGHDLSRASDRAYLFVTDIDTVNGIILHRVAGADRVPTFKRVGWLDLGGCDEEDSEGGDWISLGSNYTTFDLV